MPCIVIKTKSKIMEKKLIAVLIIILAVAGLALGYVVFVRPKNVVTPSAATPIVQKETAEESIGVKTDLGESTSDVDKISSSIISQLQAEENKFSAEDSEADVIIDQSALNDFGQSYDPNEF